MAYCYGQHRVMANTAGRGIRGVRGGLRRSQIVYCDDGGASLPSPPTTPPYTVSVGKAWLSLVARVMLYTETKNKRRWSDVVWFGCV